MYKHPISEFDLPKFLKHLEDHYTCEDSESYNGCILVDRTDCANIEDLRAQGSRIIGTVDIYNKGFLLEEYIEFCELEDGEEDEEDIIERLGKEGCDKILDIGKARGWESDQLMRDAAMDEGILVPAVCVSISGDDIIVETGYIGEDPPDPITRFGGSIGGMPEVESMIKDLVESCVRKSKKRRPSKTS